MVVGASSVTAFVQDEWSWYRLYLRCGLIMENIQYDGKESVDRHESGFRCVFVISSLAFNFKTMILCME